MGWLAVFLISLSGFLYVTQPTPALQATVIIESRGGHGSGVFISPTQVLTARHVAEHVEGGLKVRGPEGDIYHIIGVANGPADIAILTVDRPIRGVPLKTSCRPLERGDKITFYANPLNIEFAGPFEITFVGGKPIIKYDDTESHEMMDSALLVSGESEPGVSGAGVIDSSGRVVGVYNFAWNGTTYGGFVSLSYPAVCEFVQQELTQAANA
jgi:S1-C subfamily serine protease